MDKQSALAWASETKANATKEIDVRKRGRENDPFLWCHQHILSHLFVVEFMDLILKHIDCSELSDEDAAEYLSTLQSVLIYEQIRFTGAGNVDAGYTAKEAARAEARSRLLCDCHGPLFFAPGPPKGRAVSGVASSLGGDPSVPPVA